MSGRSELTCPRWVRGSGLERPVVTLQLHGVGRLPTLAEIAAANHNGRWRMTSPRRVLIAEDEALIRLDLAEMLAEEGFEVVGEAGDGEEAVALAIKLKPDLVILDVKMPKKDGIDAAAEIVAGQIAPVVMLTAFSQRDLIERARDAGAMAYLVKPFSPADLLPAIELAVARYAEMVALREEVSDVTARLETRKLIDRAKGLLMTNQKMTEPEAFRWIQRTAMDRRTSMQAVAQAVLEGLGAKP